VDWWTWTRLALAAETFMTMSVQDGHEICRNEVTANNFYYFSDFAFVVVALHLPGKQELRSERGTLPDCKMSASVAD